MGKAGGWVDGLPRELVFWESARSRCPPCARPHISYRLACALHSSKTNKQTAQCKQMLRQTQSKTTKTCVQRYSFSVVCVHPPFFPLLLPSSDTMLVVLTDRNMGYGDMGHKGRGEGNGGEMHRRLKGT